MRIYLADLTHNLLTISSDVYPMAIANLATYVRAHLEGMEDAEIRLFREPQELKAALDDSPPDILGVSNYSWNHELSYQFVEYARRGNPGLLTLMGGPNWPLDPSVQESFVRGMPALDVYIAGPTYEGERAFLNLVRRYKETGERREGVFEAPIDGSFYIHPGTDDFVFGDEVPRIRDLDDIPSPYLEGLLDSYFDTGYFPMLQIARGCPFTCTYCNSAVKGNSKICAHSVENVKADLLYIAQRVNPEITACFADDNFGMYARDEEIAEYIGFLQDTYGWPKYIRTTTGKNQGERIIRVMRKAHGALPMTAAVQSLNPAVLKNIKRDNIKLETYTQLQEELKRQGMQSYGELILSMPGETRQTFMMSVEKLLDSGCKRISAHQLMLLHGAPLSKPSERERFQFKTAFRVVARNVGNYVGEPVIEVEEMVVDTPDFPFADYLEARVFHLLLTIFHYEGNFEEAFAFARHHGVSGYQLCVLLQERLDQAPEEFRQVIRDFLRESQEELFPSRRDVIDWAREHYDGLVSGDEGGNLLSKYSMLGRFYATHSALDFLQDTVAAAIQATGDGHDEADLQTVMDYMRAVMLHVPFAQSMAREVSWRSTIDVEAWEADTFDKPANAYRLEEPRTFRAMMDEDRKSRLQTRVDTFGEHPSGLGKFTRTMFARDVRRSLVPEGSRSLVESHV
jgi:radical SAM superfamily enzyme YgiQ (UPF0313 family)